MKSKFAFAVILGSIAGLPGIARADSCLGIVANQQLDTNTLSLATLNKNGTASWSSFGVVFRGPIKSASGAVRPAQWSTNNDFNPKDVAKQLFSDRNSGVGTDKQQPFDIRQADQINVVFTAEASPQVTVTLRTWGNVKASFQATCSPGGVMHGSTPDVDYLLILRQVTRR